MRTHENALAPKGVTRTHVPPPGIVEKDSNPHRTGSKPVVLPLDDLRISYSTATQSFAEPLGGIEPPSTSYKDAALPLSYRGLGPKTGYDPASLVPQTSV